MFIITHAFLVGKKLSETLTQAAHGLLCFFPPSIELNLDAPPHTHTLQKGLQLKVLPLNLHLIPNIKIFLLCLVHRQGSL